MWNSLLHCSLVTALKKEIILKNIKMLPKFKGTNYEEVLKRADLHDGVRVDLVRVDLNTT